MNPNVKLNEKIAILATIDPASAAVGTVSTAYIPVANFSNISALLKIGVIGALGTIDAKLVQSQDAAGTGVKPITGKAIAQVLAAGGNSKQVSIECRADDLDTNNGFGFVALSVTIGTAASFIDAALIGANPRYYPASQYNQTGVVQVV